jgi:acetyl-CoA/propionyl-CoA carboxylase biotin carboxyl carrier protein
MYDPMVAKLIVWDVDRAQATSRMLRALHEYEIEGLKTLIPFHRALLATEQWRAGETCRDLLEDRAWLKSLAFEKPPAAEGSDGEEEAATVEQTYTVEVSGKRFDVRVVGPPFAGASSNGTAPAAGATAPRRASGRSARGGGATATATGSDTLVSPLQGNMWKVLVAKGDAVQEGQLLCIIEAMKMENEITAHKSGTITELPIAEGEPIQAGAPIATISSAE